MKLIDRFKRLTFWNKLGVIAAVASLIGIPLSLFLYWFPQNANNSVSAARVAAITNLKSDLEKVKTLLPFNQTFSDCLKRRDTSFEAAIEACTREYRSSANDAQQIIVKNRASLQLHFSKEELTMIDDHLRVIKFLAYEMWNNQLVLESWRKKGCPSDIAILSAEEGAKILQNKGSKIKCVIAIEDYKSFFERDARNENLITALRGANVPTDSINIIVIPGQENTIDNFFFQKNNSLYKTMLEHIHDLTPLLGDLIKK